ncbi:hypothetical protein [Aerococcus suis]|uniref:Uncharacterized protein n=1 Tax=Aerococcus suis TaxID=371602 RepID=A0A1W1Y414_9LACT|nr:hypothetical protein [Aerococcus suis]MDY4646344.1 hypothetical protein [Aerococcus suis]SMC30877.1 hypothetical protein SAMN04487984_0305 [Aerococcus suis]
MDEWTDDILDRAYAQATSYEEKALFEAVKQSIRETDKRLEQAKGQLDGMAWDKEGWE